jgi:ectoine hydroxylase-related dioxygenase (phytanoyl-CoA dioxygenase family)
VISEAMVEAYRRDGFVVVPSVLDQAEVSALRGATEELVEKARFVREHNEIYDLEPNHSPQQPRVRRIKTPHLYSSVYDQVMRHPAIVAALQALMAPSVRFDTGKLNIKEAGGGAAVEWHQDWAFYPHTNDDLCAVGIMMDDCELENGPLLCIPGSHKGPVHDHHSGGVFCGAIDPVGSGIDFSAAVACTGKAGSISVHHVRTIHGSAPNLSNRPRRLLLYQYRAADAWPLLGGSQPAFDAWNGLMLAGEADPVVPRLADVPVRLPLPPAHHQGSIYENQRGLANTYFAAPKVAKAG